MTRHDDTFGGIPIKPPVRDTPKPTPEDIERATAAACGAPVPEEAEEASSHQDFVQWTPVPDTREWHKKEELLDAERERARSLLAPSRNERVVVSKSVDPEEQAESFLEAAAEMGDSPIPPEAMIVAPEIKQIVEIKKSELDDEAGAITARHLREAMAKAINDSMSSISGRALRITGKPCYRPFTWPRKDSFVEWKPEPGPRQWLRKSLDAADDAAVEMTNELRKFGDVEISFEPAAGPGGGLRMVEFEYVTMEEVVEEILYDPDIYDPDIDDERHEDQIEALHENFCSLMEKAPTVGEMARYYAGLQEEAERLKRPDACYETVGGTAGAPTAEETRQKTLYSLTDVTTLTMLAAQGRYARAPRDGGLGMPAQWHRAVIFLNDEELRDTDVLEAFAGPTPHHWGWLVVREPVKENGETVEFREKLLKGRVRIEYRD